MRLLLVSLLLLASTKDGDAWISPPLKCPDTTTSTYQASRRDVLVGAVAAAFWPLPALALVKGNAPPPKAKLSERPKCTNVEECQRLAEEKEAQERSTASQNSIPISSVAGTKYYDIVEGTGETAKTGNEVTVYYKVLKLGKRSYDGLSGEGTVVFSRGYGLEDEENKAREKSFVATLGNPNNIVAINNAVKGMKVGGIRRFSVFPDQGWRKPGQACDGGPGGQGSGGDLKTDYVVVPTATMVAAEACFDTMKLPFPTSYAEQRRMAQRFDQSLIMEVELVHVDKDSDLAF